MLSYTTPATIARNNAEAERLTGTKLVGSGVDRAVVTSRSESLAKGHADALARRNAG